MPDSMTVRERLPEQGLPEVHVAVTDPVLQALIRTAAVVQERIRSFEPASKYLEDTIVAAALEHIDDDGEVVFTTPDRIRASVRVEYSWGEIPDGNVFALHELLGERYFDLVERQVILRPTPALIAMACDGDRGMEIRKYLSIRRKAPVVTIVADCSSEKGT